MFELLRTLTNGEHLSSFAPMGDVVRARTAWASPFATLAAPAADVVETADAIRVLIDLPGLAEDAIAVKFENDLLSVEAERKADGAKGETNLVGERVFGKLRRTFAVNVPVDGEHIEAAYARGVLTVTLPKRAEAKPRKIDVKVK